MFNEIADKQGLMEKMYFGTREVKAATQPDVAQEDGTLGKHDEVLLEYADDKLPKYEAVKVEEWELGRSSAPVTTPDEYQKWSVKRMQPLRLAAMKPFETFNPRYKDIKGVLDWIEYGFQQSLRYVTDRVFGCDFLTEGTVDMVLKKIEETGEDPKQGLSPLAIDLLDVFRKHNVIATQVSDGRIFKPITEHFSQLIDYGVDLALGSSDECRRLNDIEDLMIKYAEQTLASTTPPAESAPQPTETGPVGTPVEGEVSGEDVGAGQDTSGSEATVDAEGK